MTCHKTGHRQQATGHKKNGNKQKYFLFSTELCHAIAPQYCRTVALPRY